MFRYCHQTIYATQNSTLRYRQEMCIRDRWYVVDATDVVLGRLAAQVAKLLRGKHKPYFTPNLDCGDYVVVINADKVKLTGKKLTDKKYYKLSLIHI